MTTNTCHTASIITAPSRFSLSLAHMLCDDIDPAKFADRQGTTINHPAFVLGHCAYYAGVCIEILGGTVEFDQGEADLYKHGSECKDDASLYPDKNACIAHFEARCNAAADFIDSCDPDVFEKSADGSPFESRFGTLGAVASFMLIGHPCFHLGQISAWRRVAGMGSAT